MCIVIDVNTFAPVFDSNSQRHSDFKPILDWILNGQGKIVYGGTKYKNELRNATKYLRLFGELQKRRKIVEVNQDLVDAKQLELEAMITNRDFDDPHLIAIICISGCKLICSDDERAFRFIKEPTLYPRHVSCPKIYRKVAHRNMLIGKNIADACKPTVVLNRAERQTLGLE